MSLQLAILSSITLLVDSTEASPFWWVDINKRAAAAAAEDDKASTTTTTKKAVKAAVETDPNDKFSNKPTSKTTTKKPASTKPTSKASSAIQPSISSTQPSVSNSIVTSPTPPPVVVPPLMVTSTPSVTNAISPSATPSSASDNANGGGVSGGAIGGIVAAVIIIILGAVAYFFVRRKKNLKQQRNRRMSTKPDPFTMGYGSDQAFHSQPPMQQTYQHQYGVQPNVAVTSPTSPTSPYYNNSSSNTQFHDANNHIIAESMMPAVVPAHDTHYQQPYQSQLQPQPQQQQYQQSYQPQLQQPQPQQQIISNAAVDSNNTLVAAPTVASAGAASIAAGISNKLLPPTQSNSVGVFYVAATYTPTLSDEIDIQTGDQVEVLVEYDDGWCQGINLTRGNIKGVFPKHCIDYTTGTTAAAASVTATGTSAAEVDRVKRVSSMYIA